MSYPFNYPNPSNADVQIFLGPAGSSNIPYYSWVKPAGVSFVWFTLIGAGGQGGGGDGTFNGGGGGSGAVTNCLMPAFLVPDTLAILVSDPLGVNAGTQVRYRAKNTTYILLDVGAGGNGATASAGTGGVASTRTNFACAGLFQSTAGQNGFYNSNVTASTSTFLSGGGDTSTTITGNYGYTASASTGTKINGYFQFQPIIVGRGSSVNVTVTTKKDDVKSGIGCGGAGALSTYVQGQAGGQSCVVIISW